MNFLFVCGFCFCVDRSLRLYLSLVLKLSPPSAPLSQWAFVNFLEVPGAVLRRSEMWWRCNHVIKSRKKLYSQSKTTKIKFHLNN